MKFLIAVAALVAVAAAAPEVREKRGILSYAAPAVVDSVVGSSSTSVISGPSGQIVSTQSNPAVVARSVYPGVVAAPSVYSNVVAAPSVYSAYAAPVGAYASPYAAVPYAAAPYAALPYAAAGVTAGTVYAPGTTLVGPSTNGAPGAVITNTPYGAQVYV